MNGFFKIDKNFIKNIFERTQCAIENGREFEKDKKNAGLPSNELLIEKISSCLTVELIETLIETCFVASMEKEEGRFYNFSITLKPQECEDGSSYQFHEPIEFNSASITKLTPAINPNYYCIDTWFNKDGNLEIWGFSEKSNTEFTFSTSSSGKIILNCALGLKDRFKCFISMSETGFISLKSYSNPVADWLEEVYKKEGLKSFFLERNSDLGDILLNMFSHGNGGTILLVPKEIDKWKNSIQHPILYKCLTSYQDKRVNVKYSAMETYFEERMKPLDGKTVEEKIKGLLTTPIHNEALNSKFSLNEHNTKEALLDIGNLTKIDGATVLAQDFEILAFGARIKPIDSNQKPEDLIMITPYENLNARKVSLSTIGGTRHQSAAQFVFDQKESIAVVASHDGRLSVFWWNKEHNIVIMMKHYEAMIG